MKKYKRRHREGEKSLGRKKDFERGNQNRRTTEWWRRVWGVGWQRGRRRCPRGCSKYILSFDFWPKFFPTCALWPKWLSHSTIFVNDAFEMLKITQNWFFWNPCSYWVSQQRSRTFTSEVSSKELTTNTALFWFCGMFKQLSVSNQVSWGSWFARLNPQERSGSVAAEARHFDQDWNRVFWEQTISLLAVKPRQQTSSGSWWSKRKNVWMSWIPPERTTTVHNGRLPAEILARRRLW